MSAWKRTASTVALAAVLVASGCGSDDEPTANGAPGTTVVADDVTAEEHATDRTGPSATMTEPLDGGGGRFMASAVATDFEAVGYEEIELVAEGTAVSYTSDGPLPADGEFELAEADQADYRTRTVVRRPVDPADANGTVVVEWLNVSSGSDTDPVYANTSEALVRDGYVWVGVSAQVIGVEGGPVAVPIDFLEGLAGEGLKGIDPERYGTLDHPGDAFAYDIFTQVGRALRAPDGPLGDLPVDQVLAVGQSQSAFALTTYANGVQPLTEAFDGFLIFSRGGGTLPLGEPGEALDIVSALTLDPVQIRDLPVPVLVLQSETDVVGLLDYYPARQDDTDRFRLWEVAGSAHADVHVLGGMEGILDCGLPINAGPMHLVAKSALVHLDRWVRTGEAPPEADRLEVADGEAERAFVLDDNGNVVGGIRTPLVDAPVAVLSGTAPEDSSIICLLFGSTVPFDDDRLSVLYPSVDDYLSRFATAADAAVAAGFVLKADRGALDEMADPDAVTSALG